MRLLAVLCSLIISVGCISPKQPTVQPQQNNVVMETQLPVQNDNIVTIHSEQNNQEQSKIVITDNISIPTIETTISTPTYTTGWNIYPMFSVSQQLSTTVIIYTGNVVFVAK